MLKKLLTLKYFIFTLMMLSFASCTSVKKYNEQRLSIIPLEKLRQDVDFAYQKLQEMHPNLNWYISKKRTRF